MHNVPRNNLINIQIADDVFNIDSDKSFASVKLRFKFRDGDELKISAKRNYINVIEQTQTENVFRLKKKKNPVLTFEGITLTIMSDSNNPKFLRVKIMYYTKIPSLLSSPRKKVPSQFRTNFVIGTEFPEETN